MEFILKRKLIYKYYIDLRSKEEIEREKKKFLNKKKGRFLLFKGGVFFRGLGESHLSITQPYRRGFIVLMQ